MLIANGVSNAVFGTSSVPADTESDKYEKHIRADARACVILTSTMARKQAQSVMACKTAKEIWKKLNTIHEQCSASRKVGMLRTFNNMKMEVSESVLEYTTRMRQMVLFLKDVSEIVSDATLIARILDGLPGKFDLTIEAWDNMDAEKQTMDALEETLIKAEQRIATKEEATALMAVSGKEAQRKSSFAGKPRNTSRAQSGGQSSSEKGNDDVIQCYFCKHFGHISRHCRKRKRKARTEGARNNNNVVKNPVMHPVNFKHNRTIYETRYVRGLAG